MVYLRFVVPSSHPDTGVADGVFRTAYALRDAEGISQADRATLEEQLAWFSKHLPIPARFNRTRSKGYYRRNPKGIAWFRNNALKYIPYDYVTGKTYNGKCGALAGLSRANRYFSLIVHSKTDDFLAQLHGPIEADDLAGLRLLVTSVVEANTRSIFGYTPLMMAARAGNTRIIDFLLSAGAAIDAVNDCGESALACAVLEGECGAIETLLNAGAPIAVRPHGVSLLEFGARGGGRFKTQRHFELLREAGAI